jgi:hypothetical protein
MKKYALIPVLGLFIALAVAPLAYASDNTEFKLKILPFNCVFEYVNDGSNKILYMTPKECGQHIGQNNDTDTFGPMSVPSGSDSESGASSDLPILQGSGSDDATTIVFLDSAGPLDDVVVPENAEDPGGAGSLAPGLPTIGAILNDDAYQPVALSGNSWTKPAVAGAVVVAAGVAADAIFGFSATKFATDAAYSGAGHTRRIVRLLLRR